MPVIGNDHAGTIPGYQYDHCKGTRAAAYLYTAAAGDQVDRFYWYGHTWGVAGKSVDIAVYTVSGGLPATRVHTPANIPVSGNSPAWFQSGPQSIALSAGVTYCVAIHGVNQPYGYLDDSANAESRDNVTSLPATWTHDEYKNDAWSFYANVVNVGDGGPACGWVGGRRNRRGHKHDLTK